MDFIERLFGLAPDGGNGSYEFLLCLELLLLVVLAGVHMSRWYWRKGNRALLTSPRRAECDMRVVFEASSIQAVDSAARAGCFTASTVGCVLDL